MITIQEYIDLNGRSPYAKWFNRLNAPAAAKITTAVVRMELGNFSASKGIGEGVFECRIDLGGGTKKRQQKDIVTAKKLWKEYKRRKRQEQ